MKILILGHGQHGKDSAANLLKTKYGFKFASSSEFVFERIIWPVLYADYITGVDIEVMREVDNEIESRILDSAKANCYADRRKRREEWRKIISDYTAGNKAKLAIEITSEYDIYVGQRAADEYEASRWIFDLVFWIHMAGRPYGDLSMKISFDPNTMIPIVNIKDHGDLMLEQMSKHVDKVLAQ